MTAATTIAYLAGVIDSDGYIGVTVKHNKNGWQDSYQPRVQVKQVEHGAVDLFDDVFGGHLYQQGPSVPPHVHSGLPLEYTAPRSSLCSRLLSLS